MRVNVLQPAKITQLFCWSVMLPSSVVIAAPYGNNSDGVHGSHGDGGDGGYTRDSILSLVTSQRCVCTIIITHPPPGSVHFMQQFQ